MGISFSKKSKGKQPPKTDAAFEKWYETHKDDFNSERRRRYHSDPAYKERVLATSQRSRANRRKSQVASKPAEYAFNLADASEHVDVTVWTMRNWRMNKYFPEPLRFGGEVWFTAKQMELLEIIKNFFVQHNIRRISAVQKQQLEEIVHLVHSNWG